MENIFWTGFSAGDRHTAIDEIKRAVSGFGYIVDFHIYSDISLSMTIEIEEKNIDNLYDALTHIIDLHNFDYLNSRSNKERTVYLNIAFSKGTGNLRIEVPSVPG